MSGRRKVSLVWKYFEDNGNETAACKTCGKELMTKIGSTSALDRHLKGRHESLHSDLQEERKAKRRSDEEKVALTSFNRREPVKMDGSSVKRLGMFQCDRCVYATASETCFKTHQGRISPNLEICFTLESA
jgi:hypothetical protein